MSRLPEYLKRPLIDTDKTRTVRHILKGKNLNTVCDGARCPNKNECYQNDTAAFLIMGNVCTRNCRYCSIETSKPLPLDKDEPKHLAEAIKELRLDYAVITSVTRDDLPDGGAEHFSKCIYEIRKICPDIKIEILTPDFGGRKAKLNKSALDTIIKASPDVFNHNIETVRSVYKGARPLGDYDLSLSVLKYVRDNSDIPVKSGLMIGLGEGMDEIFETFADLKNAGCTMLTVGQYIQPTKRHLRVERFYELAEYEILREKAEELGFLRYKIAPLARSSYHASDY